MDPLHARRALAASLASVCLISCAGAHDHESDGGAGGATGHGGAATTGNGGATTTTTMAGGFAQGISVTDVEVNQGVGIAVVTAGKLVDPSQRTAPVVGQRHGMVRVSWALDPSFTPRNIEAVVTLTDGNGKSAVLRQTKMVSGPPDLKQLDGTFHWDIDGTILDGGTTFSVELREVSGSGKADPGAARFPASGAAALGAIGGPMTLKVVILPANAAGCQGAPPPSFTSEDKSTIEAGLWNIYPINTLEITYHAPVTLPVSDCMDDGAIADAVGAIRDAEMTSKGVGDDVYYHAIFAYQDPYPYAAGGMSWLLTDVKKGDGREGFSVDWEGGFHANVSHEIGHSHGRTHTWEDPGYLPTGTPNLNCGRRAEYGYGVYPGQHPLYGVWNDYPPMKDVQGWLIPPTESLGDNNASLGDYGQCEGAPTFSNDPPNMNDVMNYVYPWWVSSYTYAAFATRIQALAALEGSAGPTQRVLQGVFLRDGKVRWRLRNQQVTRTLPVDGKNRARLDLPGGSRELPIAHKLSDHGRVAGVIIPLPEEARAESLKNISAIVDGREIQAEPADLRKALRAP